MSLQRQHWEGGGGASPPKLHLVAVAVGESRPLRRRCHRLQLQGRRLAIGAVARPVPAVVGDGGHDSADQVHRSEDGQVNEVDQEL